jgi:hypothetical protein
MASTSPGRWHVWWLIDRFLASPKNNQKWQPRTKRLYEGYLSRLRADLGDLRFADFGVAELEGVQIAFQSQPRKCNQIVGLLRKMLHYAVRFAHRPGPQQPAEGHPDRVRLLALPSPSCLIGRPAP